MFINSIIKGGFIMTIIFINKISTTPFLIIFFFFLTKLRGIPVRTGMTIFFFEENNNVK